MRGGSSGGRAWSGRAGLATVLAASLIAAASAHGEVISVPLPPAPPPPATVEGPPIVITGDATPSTTSATLEGSVQTEGQILSCFFEWGEDEAFTAGERCTQGSPSAGYLPVSAVASGLLPGHAYT